jgi:hypothetical protein
MLPLLLCGSSAAMTKQANAEEILSTWHILLRNPATLKKQTAGRAQPFPRVRIIRTRFESACTPSSPAIDHRSLVRDSALVGVCFQVPMNGFSAAIMGDQAIEYGIDLVFPECRSK